MHCASRLRWWSLKHFYVFGVGKLDGCKMDGCPVCTIGGDMRTDRLGYSSLQYSTPLAFPSGHGVLAQNIIRLLCAFFFQEVSGIPWTTVAQWILRPGQQLQHHGTTGRHESQSLPVVFGLTLQQIMDVVRQIAHVLLFWQLPFFRYTARLFNAKTPTHSNLNDDHFLTWSFFNFIHPFFD